MQNLSEVLNSKKFVRNQSQRPVNTIWEEANEFAKYVGLNTVFVLKLFKVYGKAKVLSQKSWLKDAPSDNTKGGKTALLVWRLKEITK